MQPSPRLEARRQQRTTRTLSLLNAEADIIERLEAEQVDTIAKDARFNIHKALSVENKCLFFRCSKKPFDDVRFRSPPATAFGYKNFGYTILPAFVLAVEITPFIVRTLTTSLGEVMQANFIDEARVRGLPGPRIVYAHALRNASAPLINLLGIQLSTLIGGVLVIEYIFDYPGLGDLMVVSVVGRDFPVIQGIAITTSAVFVFINVIVDLVAYLVDLRVEL